MFNAKRFCWNRITGQKGFCKVTIWPTGVVEVKYFMPRYGFSVIWAKEPLVKINNVWNSKDDKKSIVQFLIHPTFFMGKDFNNPTYNTMQEAIDNIYTNYLKIL